MPKGQSSKKSVENDPPSEDYPDDESNHSSQPEDEVDEKYYEGKEHPESADPSGSDAPLKDRSNIPYRPPHQRRRGHSPAPRASTQRRPTGRAKTLPCIKAPLLTSPDQFSVWSSRFSISVVPLTHFTEEFWKEMLLAMLPMWSNSTMPLHMHLVRSMKHTELLQG
mgnify:CR=1 FL=1